MIRTDCVCHIIAPLQRRMAPFSHGKYPEKDEPEDDHEELEKWLQGKIEEMKAIEERRRARISSGR